MVIQSIRLKDFRNYDALTLEPSPSINILYGQNGSGKTNIVEAIHYCALGKSHRTNQDREVVRKDCMSAACGVTLRKKVTKEEIAIKLTPYETKKKGVFIERKKASRLSDLMGHLQCVIFSPEDLLLIKEGPSLRRKYIDMMISQMQPVYFIELQKYQKALEQRNAILKDCRKNGSSQDEMMEVFEEQMAKSSSIIIPIRSQMIGRIGEIASQTYKDISGRDNESFSMNYLCSLKEREQIESQVKEALRKGRTDDIFRGSTSFGLHREDIQMILNEKEMKLFASQGQVRTAALSMKLSQITLFQEETGENPILLLDDVMSELDMGRRTRLVEKISSVQTFITCTDESDIALSERPRSYQISLDPEGKGTVEMTDQGQDSIEEVQDEAEPDFS